MDSLLLSHPPAPAAPLHMLNILINAFLHIKGHFVKNFTALYCFLIELNKLILARMKQVPVLLSFFVLLTPDITSTQQK